MKRFVLLVAGLLATAVLAQLQPKSARKPVTEMLHGVSITDPYRWLEDQNAPATRKWIKAQNKYSDALLKNQPSRGYLKRRLGELLKTTSYSIPTERTGRFFYSRQRPEDEQAILYYRDGLHGKDVVFLDPNKMDKAHRTTVGYQDFSKDGRYAAYYIRKGGADETVINIRDLHAGKDLPDSLPLANYWSFSLKKDFSGYYYAPHVNLVGVRIKYHKMGAQASQDQEIFGKGYNAEIGLGCSVSEDGNWLVIVVSQGWAKNEVYVQDLRDGSPIKPLITGMDASYSVAEQNGTFFALTDLKSPRRSVLAIDPAKPARENWNEIIPASVDALDSFGDVAGKLYCSYLHNVSSRIVAYDTAGRNLGEVKLPGIGTSTGVTGRWEGHDAFFSFASFTTPDTIYHLDPATGAADVWAQQKIKGFDPARLTTRQVWFTSKDGAKVPMFMVYKKGLKLDGKRPTLLYGYGGFNSGELPYFSRSAVIFAENGGVFVDVNLRGGNEFGEAWHQAGMLGKKQNVFDDFIGAAQWLIKKKVTNRSKLAIRGGSNGGLLVGAAMTQHPELFQAVLCEVPLLDMLRYHKFLQGPQWVPEYGSADDAAQFKWLYAYSPYQHVKKGVQYPAVLFDSGDADTRVAPLHARKMTALMQWATASRRPILLHYETQSGHSGGESLSQEIEHASLSYAFLFWQLGIVPRH